ncbi:hypothetical protein LWI28_017358 [Acer negundo]|uniref:Uncharacterized protein n=1 Tax=Acer negundo TaxID=4023 RepID=A0AAD5IWG5_ACENE|nr:hypothetical protein LWI28_017358 [Acer negundo]
MAKEGIFLETFLFNLPYPSVPIEKITHKKVKHVIRGAGNAFRPGLVLAMKKKSGDPLKTWAPCLFVNPADFICSKYDGYFEHKKKMEKFGLGAGAKAEEDSCCEETEGGGGVVPGAALSADKGPAAALMKAGLTGGTAATDGEYDVAESMYGGNFGGCTVVEGAD